MHLLQACDTCNTKKNIAGEIYMKNKLLKLDLIFFVLQVHLHCENKNQIMKYMRRKIAKSNIFPYYQSEERYICRLFRNRMWKYDVLSYR